MIIVEVSRPVFSMTGGDQNKAAGGAGSGTLQKGVGVGVEHNNNGLECHGYRIELTFSSLVFSGVIGAGFLRSVNSKLTNTCVIEAVGRGDKNAEG